jgi:pyruvate/2-oxoglutarate dehydrogenase complex dihydrolipoamide acyltransferase (E2) component
VSDGAPEAKAPVRRRAQEAPKAGDSIRLIGMRKIIAQRMHASLQEMAQLTHGFEVRMDAVVDARAARKESGGKAPSITDFIVRAAALGLRDHPLLNAVVEEKAIRLYDRIDIGVAVAVPNGLLLPVVRGSADLGIAELGAEVKRLAEACREGTITPDEQAEPTFSVTSLGGYGVDMFTPIVTPGTVAILGVGRMRDGVAWDGDTPKRTRVLTLSLSFDHRAVDGAPAAEYLQTVGRLLDDPDRLLS